MDKKAKKKIDVLHDRITKLRQQLAGARSNSTIQRKSSVWNATSPRPRQS